MLETHLCDGRVALEALGQGLCSISTKLYAIKIQFVLLGMLHQQHIGVAIFVFGAMSVSNLHIAKQGWQQSAFTFAPLCNRI